ncbi:MAG TPA: TetR/AcrR family transcriptional regulator [Polyangiales bacterium]|nr:TetR/AcrR family transcriptional regulator [Polyangiales bacterium]
MARQSLDKRTRLILTAAKLAHEHGFHSTSLADIARESDVPLGNVYYYFRTKEALGEALVEKLAENFASARARWDGLPDATARLEAFIQMTIDSRESLARSGCPIGTLCAELHKEGGPLAEHAAKLFAEMLTWLEAQFRAAGLGSESRDHAVHLLAALQGASLLTHTFHSARYVTREASRLKAWVRSL